MSKKPKATDPTRFEGNGISYRAKIIGLEDVAEARGDKMCQETIAQLKNAVKVSGQHKQRVFMNVTLEGLKIIDGASLTVLHTHPVHQISFISRDVTDSRAFGYIYGPGDGTHKFFGIKTANAAENLVLALRDLFQTVYEMKKQEIEDAKAKAAAGTEGQGEGETINTEQQVPGEGQPAEGQESIYQVPKNNAPVNPQEQEEAVANLLDLEDQVDTILKGIEQIKNLEFDELSTEEAPRQPTFTSAPTSPTTSPTTPSTPAGNDPWGVAPSTSAAPASSSLADLQQLSNPPPTANPFGGMAAFPGTPAPSVGITAPGFPMVQPGAVPFGVPGQQPMVRPGMGLPPAQDPFGDSPFLQRAQAPQMMAAPGVPFGQQPGFGSPFPPTGQPFPGAMAAPGVQPGFGVPAPAFTPFGVPAPGVGMGMQLAPPAAARGGGSPFQQPEENLLQPIKPGGQEEPASQPKPSPLFGDLVDIKKSAGVESAAKSPKEMFKELTQPPKKSLNEIRVEGGAPPKASVIFDQDPFAEDPFGSLDTVLNNIASSDPDPFDTSYIPPPSSAPPLPPPSLPPQPPAPPDPFPDLTLSAPSSKESSPETRFDMPDEPPPPLPSHLKASLSAPSPPPRPPPVPSRPMPKQHKSSPSSPAVSASPFSTSFGSPPPLPTSPRPSSSVASSSPASELSTSDTAASAVDSSRGMQSSSLNNSARSSPSVAPARAPPSPSHSWGSTGTLSQSSSQKSLDRTLATADNDDPFGVPLRSKKSFSSADGASKRSSRSSGKLSVKSDSKVSLGVDPFGVPLADRTSSSQGAVEKSGSVNADNPFSVSAFNDVVSATSSPGKWEAFGDHPANGVMESQKSALVSSNGQRPPASPFGDSFLAAPVNGKPSDAQS